MKFGQLIERSMRNIFFLEKSYTKCGADTVPRPFSKKSKLGISLDQYSKVSCSLLFMIYQVEDYQKILKLRCRPLAFTCFFFKTKGLELESLPHFLYDSLKKNISYILYIYYLIYFLYFLYKNICYILLPGQI